MTPRPLPEETDLGGVKARLASGTRRGCCCSGTEGFALFFLGGGSRAWGLKFFWLGRLVRVDDEDVDFASDAETGPRSHWDLLLLVLLAVLLLSPSEQVELSLEGVLW